MVIVNISCARDIDVRAAIGPIYRTGILGSFWH
jgi:hypothetical protein